LIARSEPGHAVDDALAELRRHARRQTARRHAINAATGASTAACVPLAAGLPLTALAVAALGAAIAAGMTRRTSMLDVADATDRAHGWPQTLGTLARQPELGRVGLLALPAGWRGDRVRGGPGPNLVPLYAGALAVACGAAIGVTRDVPEPVDQARFVESGETLDGGEPPARVTPPSLAPTVATTDPGPGSLSSDAQANIAMPEAGGTLPNSAGAGPGGASTDPPDRADLPTRVDERQSDDARGPIGGRARGGASVPGASPADGSGSIGVAGEARPAARSAGSAAPSNAEAGDGRLAEIEPRYRPIARYYFSESGAAVNE